MAYWVFQNSIQTGALVIPFHSIGTPTDITAQIVIEVGDYLPNAYLCLSNPLFAGYVLAKRDGSDIYYSVMPEIDPNCYLGSLFPGQTIDVQLQIDVPPTLSSGNYEIQILLRGDLKLPGPPNNTFYGGAGADYPTWANDEAESPIWVNGYGKAPYWEAGSICRKKTYGRLLPETPGALTKGKLVYGKKQLDKSFKAEVAKNNGMISEAGVLGVVDNDAIDWAYRDKWALCTDLANTIYWHGEDQLVYLDWLTKQWFSLGSGGGNKIFHSLTYLAGDLYAYGGSGSKEFYKYSGGSWSQLPDGPRVRSCHATITYGDEIHFVGGTDGTNAVLVVDIFNTKTGVWIEGSLAPLAFNAFTFGDTEETTPEFFVCGTTVWYGDYNAKQTGVYYTYDVVTENFSDPELLVSEDPGRGIYPSRPLRVSDVKQNNFVRLMPYGARSVAYWVGIGQNICRYYSEDTGYWYTADIQSRRFLKDGFVTNSAWNWTINGQVWLDGNGDFTQTRPTANTEQCILAGHAVSTTTICFHVANGPYLAWDAPTGAAIARFSDYVWQAGGLDESNNPIATFKVFSYITEAWATLSDLPYAVSYASATYANGYVVIVGGILSDGSASTWIQSYKLADNSWQTCEMSKGLILPMLVTTTKAAESDLFTELGMPIPGGYPGSWAYPETGHVVGGSDGVGFISGSGSLGIAGSGAITGGYGTIEGPGSGGVVGENPSTAECFDIEPGTSLIGIGGIFDDGHIGKTPADILAEDATYQNDIFGTQSDPSAGGTTGGTGTFNSGGTGNTLAGSGEGGGSGGTGGYGGSGGTPIIFGGSVNYDVGSGTGGTDGQGSGGGTGGGAGGPSSGDYTPGGSLPGQGTNIGDSGDKGTGTTPPDSGSGVTVVIGGGVTDGGAVNGGVDTYDPDTNTTDDTGSSTTGGGDITVIGGDGSVATAIETEYEEATDYLWGGFGRCPFLRLGTKLYLWLWDASKMLEYDTIAKTFAWYDLSFGAYDTPHLAEVVNGTLYLFEFHQVGESCDLVCNAFSWAPGGSTTHIKTIDVPLDEGLGTIPTMSVVIGSIIWFYGDGFCEQASLYGVYRCTIPEMNFTQYDLSSTNPYPLLTTSPQSIGFATDGSNIFWRGGDDVTDFSVFQRLLVPTGVSAWVVPDSLVFEISNNCMTYYNGYIVSTIGKVIGVADVYPDIDLFNVSGSVWYKISGALDFDTRFHFAAQLQDRLQIIDGTMYFPFWSYLEDESKLMSMYSVHLTIGAGGEPPTLDLSVSSTTLSDLGIDIQSLIDETTVHLGIKKTAQRSSSDSGGSSNRGGGSAGNTGSNSGSGNGMGSTTTQVVVVDGQAIKVTTLTSTSGAVQVVSVERA